MLILFALMLGQVQVVIPAIHLQAATAVLVLALLVAQLMSTQTVIFMQLMTRQEQAG